MEIQEELRVFVIDRFLFGQNGHLNDDDSFLDNGVIDSTGVLELIAFLEERFGIRMEDGDLIPDNLDSIDNIARFLRQKTAEPNAAS